MPQYDMVQEHTPEDDTAAFEVGSEASTEEEDTTAHDVGSEEEDENAADKRLYHMLHTKVREWVQRSHLPVVFAYVRPLEPILLAAAQQKVKEQLPEFVAGYKFADKSVYSDECVSLLGPRKACCIAVAMFVLQAGLMTMLLAFEIDRHQAASLSDDGEEDPRWQVTYGVAVFVYVVIMVLPRGADTFTAAKARWNAVGSGVPFAASCIIKFCAAVDVASDLIIVGMLVANVVEFDGMDSVLNIVAFEFIGDLDNHAFELWETRLREAAQVDEKTIRDILDQLNEKRLNSILRQHTTQRYMVSDHANELISVLDVWKESGESCVIAKRDEIETAQKRFQCKLEEALAREASQENEGQTESKNVDFRMQR